MAVLIDHPCVQHKLSKVRDAETGHKRFRELSKEITQFICYEALKSIKTKEVMVETPVATATCRVIDTDLVVVPILRAGIGMLDGILELVPTARVGFVGLYRDEETKDPVSYYEQIRPDVEEINTTLMPDVIILDEAQRIKNRTSSTSQAIRSVSRSRSSRASISSPRIARDSSSSICMRHMNG